MDKEIHTVRKATVDYIFYPGKAKELAEAVDEYLSKASSQKEKTQIILSPHAGYQYTGRIMGAAFKAVAAENFTRVVILSRVHREPEKKLFLPECNFFQTPLGETAVDTEGIDALLQFNPLFRKDDIPHTEEHSIEVQLPFIQHLWPDAKILPILSGTPSLSLMRTCASGLTRLTEGSLDKTLFVVSSNLSAYDHAADAKRDTDYFLSLLEKGEWESFPDLLRKKKINACSADCLTAMYIFFSGNLKPHLLYKECDFKHDETLLKKPYEKRVCFGALMFTQKQQEENYGF